jgi:hypothetical protein
MTKIAWAPWSTLIGIEGSGLEEPGAVAISNDYIAVAGYTNSLGGFDGQQYNGGEADIFLSLFDLTGQRKWTKIIGTDKEEYIKHILIDPISGDIIIAGNERTSEGNRGFISKISNDGEELWKQQSS